MSMVTDIIFICGIDDKNAGAFMDSSKCNFARVDLMVGGDKQMQCDMYISAVNFLDLNTLLELFYATDFEDNDQVQLMVKEENDDLFRVVEK